MYHHASYFIPPNQIFQIPSTIIVTTALSRVYYRSKQERNHNVDSSVYPEFSPASIFNDSNSRDLM